MAVFPILSAFVVSACATWWLSRTRGPLFISDIPNHRSLHESTVSRAGGLAILCGLLVAALYFLRGVERWPVETMLAVGLVFSVSFLDDLKTLPAAAKLPVHAISAYLAVYEIAGAGSAYPLWLLLTLVLAIVWMINLFNFMDGLDGLAGSMALSGFAILGIIGFRVGDDIYGYWNLAVAASVAGFLLFNLPQARIFMGDSGSCTLGLFAAISGLYGVREGLIHGLIPLLVFSPFIVDATWTLFRRVVAGEPVWLAHRGHLYQRLVTAGRPAVRVLAWFWVLLIGTGVTAVALAEQPVGRIWTAVAVWILIYGVLLVSLERRLSATDRSLKKP